MTSSGSRACTASKTEGHTTGWLVNVPSTSFRSAEHSSPSSGDNTTQCGCLSKNSSSDASCTLALASSNSRNYARATVSGV